ncbi:hypothetical protein HDG37_002281 [Paraburkholderia sp. MM5384-R2]|nr:hypothetical protein [Paraburkholderia sp. MM5384-R2]
MNIDGLLVIGRNPCVTVAIGPAGLSDTINVRDEFTAR